jgi:hypothetical protein
VGNQIRTYSFPHVNPHPASSNLDRLWTAPVHSQPPQASASTNSAIRASNVDTDAVSQENAAASSPDAPAVKFTPDPLPEPSPAVDVGYRIAPLRARDVEAALEVLYACGCSSARRMPGFTYVLEAPSEGLIKIGMTDHPVRRIVGLQGQSSSSLMVRAVVHGAWLEAVLHAALASVRRHGEWFAATSPIPGYPTALCYGCAAWRVQRGSDRAWLRAKRPQSFTRPSRLAPHLPDRPYPMMEEP